MTGSSSRGDFAEHVSGLLAIAGLVLYGWLWMYPPSLGRERRRTKPRPLAGCDGAIRRPIKDKSEQGLGRPMGAAMMWSSWVCRGPAACRFVELQRVGPRRSGERTVPGCAASDRDAVTECNGIAP